MKGKLKRRKKKLGRQNKDCVSLEYCWRKFEEMEKGRERKNYVSFRLFLKKIEEKEIPGGKKKMLV